MLRSGPRTKSFVVSRRHGIGELPAETDSLASLITDATGFRATRLIGASPHSLVVSAVEITTRQLVALKFFKRSLGAEEARSWAAGIVEGVGGWGAHPGIADTLQYGAMEGYRYIARELVEGPSVQTILDRTGRLTGSEGLDLAVQIVEILEVAHSRQRHHNNITPANIFVEPYGSVRLTDWTACAGQWKGQADAGHPASSGRTENAIADLRQLGAVLAKVHDADSPPQPDSLHGLDRNGSDLMRRILRECETTLDPSRSLSEIYHELLRFLESHRRRRRLQLSALVKSRGLAGATDR